MYIKWIVCKVARDAKENFSNAQAQWAETKNSNGFVGQLGGWDLKDENTACIICFWERKADLEMFMKDIHDKIFFKNNQSKYYTAIEVEHFNLLMNMEGQSNSVIALLNKGKLLRIADCIVKKDKTQHFELAQKRIWLPGMKERAGMLGGKFSKSTKNNSRYLVSTFWDSLENHTKYVAEQLPELKNRSNVKDDLLQITGRNVLLVDSWKVLPKIN